MMYLQILVINIHFLVIKWIHCQASIVVKQTGDENSENRQLKIIAMMYLIPLYFHRTLISRKFSRHISQIFNFEIGEKNCVCREKNFANLTIQCLYFFFFTKITLI